MARPFADSPEFRRLLSVNTVPGVLPSWTEPDLARVALEIASDAHPGLDVENYLARIQAMADRVRQRCPSRARPKAILAQIQWLLYVEEGYRGNRQEYYDPRNSYLNEVIDRKTGIPITLALLYGRIAAELGLGIFGVNTPGHFFLAIDDQGDRLYIDAFDEGNLLDEAGCRARLTAMLGQEPALDPEVFGPCSLPTLVSRMLRNLKSIYLQSDDYPALLPVQRRLAALQSHDPTEQRDLALLCLRLERYAEAIRPLEAFLAKGDLPAGSEFHQALDAARREVARWN